MKYYVPVLSNTLKSWIGVSLLDLSNTLISQTLDYPYWNIYIQEAFPTLILALEMHRVEKKGEL